METGIEKLLRRIEEETDAECAALEASFERELSALAEEHAAVMKKIEDDAKEKAHTLCEKIGQRGRSAEVSAARAVLAEKKSGLVRRAFSEAAEVVRLMDNDRYTAMMARRLAAAAQEFPADAALSLVVPANHPVTGTALAGAAGIQVDTVTESDALEAGFILSSETVEIVFVPSKMIDDRREELAPAVAAILFEQT